MKIQSIGFLALFKYSLTSYFNGQTASIINLKSNFKLVLSAILLLINLQASGQTDAFARVKLNTRDVFVQQPIKASITVYTSTWFTDSPDIGSLQIPNAFVLPFKRTQSSIQYINNKKYSALEFYYLVFPYESGNMAIPAMNIIVETPPE